MDRDKRNEKQAATTHNVSDCRHCIHATLSLVIWSAHSTDVPAHPLALYQWLKQPVTQENVVRGPPNSTKRSWVQYERFPGENALPTSLSLQTCTSSEILRRSANPQVYRFRTTSSQTGQLSLAIPPRITKTSTGDVYSHWKTSREFHVGLNSKLVLLPGLEH